MSEDETGLAVLSGPSRVIGRPTLCEPETVERIALLVESGQTLKHACAGIVGYSTLKDWRDKGKAGDERYQWAYERLCRAEAVRNRGYFATLHDDATRATDDPRLMEVRHKAAKWLLEKLEPEDFGAPVQKHEHTGKDGAAMETHLTVHPVLILPPKDPLPDDD